MRQALLAVLGIGVLMASLAIAQDAVKKDRDALQGKWIIVSVERDGKAQDNFKDATRVFAGDKYNITTKSGTTLTGTFQLDPSKTPKAMNMMPGEGQYKGKTLQGIYELNGDNLKICFAEPGKDRPKDFTSRSGQVLAIHKRQK
jgi:uncharacterized protein (TIGR03067 family)